MPLNDVAVRSLKEPDKHADERGLFLLVTPAGGKWWRFRYRFEGKEKLLSLGTYPDVSLKEARQKREEARKMLGQGIDPGLQRKAEKQTQSGSAANAFETLAREWFEKSKVTWAPSHADKIIRRLERDVFPWLGTKPIEQRQIKVLTVIFRLKRLSVVVHG